MYKIIKGEQNTALVTSVSFYALSVVFWLVNRHVIKKNKTGNRHVIKKKQQEIGFIKGSKCDTENG